MGVWSKASLCKAGAIALAPLSALAMPCDFIVDSVDADLGWAVELSAPCHPYTMVKVSLGPLSFLEETDHGGGVTVSMPVIAARPAATFLIDGMIAEALPPAGTPESAFIWLKPSGGAQLGVFDPVGFPADDGSARPELGLFRPTDRPAFLDLPVNAETCGQSITFDLMPDTWTEPRPVRLQMPPCENSGTFVRVPLP